MAYTEIKIHGDLNLTGPIRRVTNDGTPNANLVLSPKGNGSFIGSSSYTLGGYNDGTILIGNDLTTSTYCPNSVNIGKSNTLGASSLNCSIIGQNNILATASASFPANDCTVIGRNNKHYGYDSCNILGSSNTIASYNTQSLLLGHNNEITESNISNIFIGGTSNTAGAADSVIIGRNNDIGDGNHACVNIGLNNTILSPYSGDVVVIGRNNYIDGYATKSICFGLANSIGSYGDASIIIGSDVDVVGNSTESISIGNRSHVENNGFGISIGVQAQVFSDYSTAIGQLAFVNSPKGVAIGKSVSSIAASTETICSFGYNSTVGKIGASLAFNDNLLTISGSGVSAEKKSSATAAAFSSINFNFQSPLINFKSTGSTTIFTVPANHVLLLDEREVVTTAINTPATAPTLSIGESGDADAYEGNFVTTSNSLNSREVIENRENAIAAGTVITATVVSASTATSHTGFVVLSGKLLRTN